MKKTSKFLDFIKSLKCRLIVWSVLLAIVPSIIVGSTILLSYEMRALDIRQSEVMSQARIIANQIATSNYMNGNKDTSDTLLSQMSMLTTIYDGRVLIVDGNFQIVYDKYTDCYICKTLENDIVTATDIAEKKIINTKEGAKKVYDFFIKNGASGLSFETIVGSGVNSAQIHSTPTDRKILENDSISHLLVDFSEKNGFFINENKYFL